MVKLTLRRYGQLMPPEDFPTLLEAVRAADSAVEWNEAAPEKIRMPSTVIGGPEVVFNAFQIYAMAGMLEEISTTQTR